MKPKIKLEYDSTLETWKATLTHKRIHHDSIATVYPELFEIGATLHEALGKLVMNYADGLGVEIWTK